MRWSVLLLALFSLANTEAPPLRVTVRPLIAQAPATIHLKLIIERHPENRMVRIAIDGENYYQAGDKALEGDAGQRVWDIWWRDVPCGTYEVSAVLVRADGKTYREASPMQVRGFSCD